MPPWSAACVRSTSRRAGSRGDTVVPCAAWCSSTALRDREIAGLPLLKTRRVRQVKMPRNQSTSIQRRLNMARGRAFHVRQVLHRRSWARRLGACAGLRHSVSGSCWCARYASDTWSQGSVASWRPDAEAYAADPLDSRFAAELGRRRLARGSGSRSATEGARHDDPNVTMSSERTA